MVTTGLYVELESKPGREKDVEVFLRDGLRIVRSEPGTIAWFAIRMGPSTFGIFDVFPDDEAREAHLAGRVAEALKARASELFAKPPAIRKLDVMAAKLDERPRPVAGAREERIPLQVGSELRIRNDGGLILDNPELELSRSRAAADATLAYHFDQNQGEHILRLLEPVAIHRGQSRTSEA
jgi:quinol monooxygenase YgiN